MNDCKNIKDESERDLSEDLKMEWLVSNAVVAFIGALMVGQAWQRSDGRVELFGLSIPDFSGVVQIAFIFFLFTLSFVFAVASLIPNLRSWSIGQGKGFSMMLGVIAWVAFIISWLTAFPSLPDDQWWKQVLLWGGVVMFFFIPLQTIHRPTFQRLLRFIFERIFRPTFQHILIPMFEPIVRPILDRVLKPTFERILRPVFLECRKLFRRKQTAPNSKKSSPNASE